MSSNQQENKMFLYVATSQVAIASGMVKIGCTTDPAARLSTYLTGCPPGLDPSPEIYYLAVYQIGQQHDLKRCEDIVHNRFWKCRLMRRVPGDSEWFKFEGYSQAAILDLIDKFIRSQLWFFLQVDPADIGKTRRKRARNGNLPPLNRYYCKNLQFITDHDGGPGSTRPLREKVLNETQAPAITAIADFLASDESAGYFVAPCGSGKTRMTVAAMARAGIRRCIICCPSSQIQEQWANTIRSVIGASEKNNPAAIPMRVGQSGTTNPDEIAEYLQRDTYCVITTYHSSHLIADIINDIESYRCDLIVLDEAHHMAGIVADVSGEGRTRRLMAAAVVHGIKRFSLTYTPRYITGDSSTKFMTMDDPATFGRLIYELNIRDMIERGILPDYRIWSLIAQKQADPIKAKAECIIQAWESTEMINGSPQYILHHLIVFAATVAEAIALETYFRESLAPANAASEAQDEAPTVVLRVTDGVDLAGPLAQFSEAPRAILVNCFMLNEGVDIPSANAVAIMYPKQSRGQITQMILRAGRWQANKPVFHVLIPTMGEENMAGFEEVLTALALNDRQIRDEICLRSLPATTSNATPNAVDIATSDPLECVIESYDSTPDEVRRCFTNIRQSVRSIMQGNDYRETQKMCIAAGIDTSAEYARFRAEQPDHPPDPCGSLTWYDFLHPGDRCRMTPDEFVKTVLEPNNLRAGYVYDRWRATQPLEVQARLPTVQHITDGYFGTRENDFTIIRQRYAKRIARR